MEIIIIIQYGPPIIVIVSIIIYFSYVNLLVLRSTRHLILLFRSEEKFYFYNLTD